VLLDGGRRLADDDDDDNSSSDDDDASPADDDDNNDDDNDDATPSTMTTKTTTRRRIRSRFWGAAPDEEMRLKIFDRIWSTLEKNYACFANKRQTLVWQAGTYVSSAGASCESYGRFYQVLCAMIDELHDTHTTIQSIRVCYQSTTDERPPVFSNNYFTSFYGACVTPTLNTN
jgi:hypothetical protein